MLASVLSGKEKCNRRKSVSPHIVLFSCVLLIIWLFWRDSVYRHVAVTAFWIPLIWLAILGSRPPALWFAPTQHVGNSLKDVDGSPYNLIIQMAIIVAAIITINKRQLSWGLFLKQNGALVCLYSYFAVSSLWSEFPLASLKRIFKDFGCVFVALVVLTEENPTFVLTTVFTRVSYIIFPLSVVFARYFPNIGRNYSIGGEPMVTGVATQKNSLGMIVFVLSLAIIFELLRISKNKHTSATKGHILILWCMLGLGAYLLHLCQSQTSLLCLLLGIIVLLGCGRIRRTSNPRATLARIAIAISFLILASSALNLKDIVLSLIGRDSTLTGRTNIWKVLNEKPVNPVIGCGYMTFWDSDMGQSAIEELRTLKTAHNGYIDVYLGGGIIGCVFLVAYLYIGAKKTISNMLSGTNYGCFGVAVWVTAIVYNFSESSFLLLGSLWFALILVLVEVPKTTSEDELSTSPI